MDDVMSALTSPMWISGLPVMIGAAAALVAQARRPKRGRHRTRRGGH